MAAYFDHNATTPPAEEVCAAMAEALATSWGNPSSLHAAGRRARSALERARDEVARLLEADAADVVFTSGGTEADALAVVGGARAQRRRDPRRDTIARTPLEHPAVRDATTLLGAEGFRVVELPVAADGRLRLADALAQLDERTALVSVALAHHELGVVQPVAAVAERARAVGALTHSDAVQAAGRIPVDVNRLGVDLLALSAHKLYGPKGVGALWQRRGAPLEPLVVGGQQERGRRGGTENVPAAIGFGVAARLARRSLDERAARLRALDERLWSGLAALGARRYGPAVEASDRVAGTHLVAFDGVPGDLLVASLDLEGIQVSTGAACTSGTLAPSPSLLALGASPAAAREAVRLSLGRGNDADEVDRLLALLPSLLARIRAAL